MRQFLRRLREEAAEPGPLPLPPGPITNGEFVPGSGNAHDRAVTQLVRRDTEESARRVGVDRRSFLQSAGAVAVSLAAFELAGCSSREALRSGTTSSVPGGTYKVPSPLDTEACSAALNGTGEFIFDVHTHHVVPSGSWVQSAPETVDLVLSMLPPGCSAATPLDCVDRANYIHDLFLASDTTMAILTDVPNSGDMDAPVPFDQELATRQLVAELTHEGSARLLVEKVVAPNVGAFGACLDEMTAAAASGQLCAFKVYTAWSPSGRGYSLEDPVIGLPTVQHAHDLGIKVFIAHKGLPLVNFDPAFNHPDDMVALSRQFPDMDFVIYHAAWDPSHVEGPYDPNASIGIDTVLAALDRHGVAPDSNVWVDLGTVWRQLLTQPDQAAHALGKLLKRVGLHRVMWGTDSIWFGSPEPQIMAMRAFEITPAFQELYGYPALTPEVKQALFGLNAASLFGVDATGVRCGLTSDPLLSAKAATAALRTEGALPSAYVPRGPTTRRGLLSSLRSARAPWRPM